MSPRYGPKDGDITYVQQGDQDLNGSAGAVKGCPEADNICAVGAHQ